MIKNPQTMCVGIGDAGCYAISLVQVAEKFTKKEIDLLKVIWLAQTENLIKFNYANPRASDNMYVVNPALFLEKMTGKKWTVTRENADYKPKHHGEYVIKSWGKDDKEGSMRHFTFDDNDPLYYSPLRTGGKLISVRVCRLA